VIARRSAARAALLAVALSTVAGAAAACPVCFASRGADNRDAFVGTTIFMSALPLLLVGAFVWWVAQRIRRHELRAPDGRPSQVP